MIRDGRGATPGMSTSTRIFGNLPAPRRQLSVKERIVAEETDPDESLGDDSEVLRWASPPCGPFLPLLIILFHGSLPPAGVPWIPSTRPPFLRSAVSAICPCPFRFPLSPSPLALPHFRRRRIPPICSVMPPEKRCSVTELAQLETVRSNSKPRKGKGPGQSDRTPQRKTGKGEGRRGKR